MRITLCGAAGEVTGSGYLVETGRVRVLVDFGMFQGRRATDERNREIAPVDAKALDAVVLTHAHLDHSGRIPILLARGFRGPIHGTEATADFTDLVVRDAAHIQESDAARDSRRLERAGRKAVRPLFTRADAERVRSRFEVARYGERVEVAPGVAVRFLDAGHILGSATVEMHAEGKVVVFSGDLGPKGAPFLRDPVRPERADLVFLESTYGDRDHRPQDETVRELREVVERAIRRGGKVLVPAFAIGRSQVILYHLAGLIREGGLPEFPIWLDSPMAIDATRLYRKHRDLFDAEAKRLSGSGQLSRDLENLQFLRTHEDSMRLNEERGPGVVLAGAGMCNGGRILHHLKHHLWHESTAVVFAGFQSPGTLGHRLVKGAREVRIFGERVRVNASVHTLGGFSAHAGQTELATWAEPFARAGARVVLTHGEPEARDALAAVLRQRFALDALRPLRGHAVEA